jgi:hypothetical protein
MFYQLKRHLRRFSFNCLLLIIVQCLIVIYLLVRFTYDRYNGVVDADDDSESCRQTFIHEYEDFCEHSLRPQPSNYMTKFYASIQRKSTVTQQQTALVDLCPCVPGDIDAVFRLDMTENLTLANLALTYNGSNDKLLPSGRWVPNWCIPRHRVAVIVPFRGREEHLLVFVNNLHRFLRAQLLDYRIFLIEQVEPEIFNRGALLNVGFLEAIKHTGEGSFDCFIFHDVDLIPADGHNFYTCSSLPRHMAAYRSGWNYRLKYSIFFGGVNSFRGEHFLRINGFSNKFYGWGGEDDDLYYRVQAKKLKLADRFPKCVSKYAEKLHERDAGNPTGIDKDVGTLYRPAEYDLDGLNTLNYTIVRYEEINLYTWIQVNLPPYTAVSASNNLSSLAVIYMSVIVCLQQLWIPSTAG